MPTIEDRVRLLEIVLARLEQKVSILDDYVTKRRLQDAADIIAEGESRAKMRRLARRAANK